MLYCRLRIALLVGDILPIAESQFARILMETFNSLYQGLDEDSRDEFINFAQEAQIHFSLLHIHLRPLLTNDTLVLYLLLIVAGKYDAVNVKEILPAKSDSQGSLVPSDSQSSTVTSDSQASALLPDSLGELNNEAEDGTKSAMAVIHAFLEEHNLKVGNIQVMKNNFNYI